jgi:hypothetical protein
VVGRSLLVVATQRVDGHLMLMSSGGADQRGPTAALVAAESDYRDWLYGVLRRIA